MESGQYLKIRANLAKKYDSTFYFFQVKPINDITYDQTLKVICIAFNDVAYLLDQNQYLKRYYFLSNKANRNEIVERIKMMSEFYNNNLVLKYEYPTMVVTKTKNIFLKKLRRMKKMVANDNSSEDSSEDNSEMDMSFDSTQFLKSIRTEKPLSDLSQSQESSEQNMLQKLSYDIEQVHKIYQNPQFQSIDMKKKDIQLNKTLKNAQVNHLICDFDDVDKQYIYAMYKKANKKTEQDKNRQRLRKKTTFVEVNQKRVQEQKKQKDKKAKQENSNIVITALDFEELKGNKNITTLYPRYQHKSHYDETIKASKNFANIQKHQTRRSEHYLPQEKKNQEGFNFQKGKKSQVEQAPKNLNTPEGKIKEQLLDIDEKQVNIKISTQVSIPKMRSPKMGSPTIGSPKMGSPASKLQEKKALNRDHRKVQMVKQKAISVLQKVKSEEKLTSNK